MKNSLFFFFGLLFTNSCIDRLNITIPDSYVSELVVDGVITDEPGPYTVNLTKATKIEKFLKFHREFITGAKVTIADNTGNAEVLTEKEPGVYQTKKNGIQGVVGREYTIKIETADSKVFESKPDMLNPVGQLDSLYYELETIQPIDQPTQYGLRIFIDTQGLAGSENRMRWKFTGVFEVQAQPLLKGELILPNDCFRTPWPCGRGDCSCCVCWVTTHEKQPRVNDNQFISNGKFRRIEAGYVPIEYFPFQTKYRIEIKQMSLSKESFDYWRIIKSQKEGTSSLFQPPTGKTRSNIFEKNGLASAQGLFYASSVKTKQLYITKNDVIKQYQALRVPHWDCEVGIIAENCLLAFENSTNQRPLDWK
jgi:Domain of unknown function (DUF4249)